MENLIVSLLTAVVAAWFAAHWSVKRFYEERNWERKEKAYEEIIHALYDAVSFMAVEKEDYGQGTGLSEEREKELYQKYYLAVQSLRKATDIGSFYISERAYSVLLELRSRKQLDFDHEPKWDFYESEYLAHKDALESLISLARDDLRIKNT